MAGEPRLRIRIDDGWRFRRDALAYEGAFGGLAFEWKQATVTSIDTAPTSELLGTDGWRPINRPRDVFRGRLGFAWFRANMGHDAKTAQKSLHFEGVDDNGAVYLNGKLLKTHYGWNDPFDVPLTAAWKNDSDNELVVLIQNTAGGGGITGDVSLVAPSKTRAGTPPEAGPNFLDMAWQRVHVPYDYVLDSPFDHRADTGHGSLATAPAWFRRDLDLPKSWQYKTVWIDFDGVYRDARVYLNGVLVGKQPSGYTPFRVSLKGAAHFGGRNILAVHVDPRKQEGWWYEGGGIYRHVWLNAADAVHVEPWSTFVKSDIRWRTDFPPTATAQIQTTLTNEAAHPASCLLSSDIIDPSGKRVAASKSPMMLPTLGARVVSVSLGVGRAQLWSLESPKLYHLNLSVYRNGKLVDSESTAFGVRSIRFDKDNGFFLNGKHVVLKGTCNHQDHAGVGIGVPDSLLEWRIRTLKKMGSNAYRTSHNPVASELLDDCDRLGMLVMDENRHLGDTETPKSSESTPCSDLSELKTLVERDRNHPSVIMWSMCNEEGIQGTKAGAAIFSAMMKVTNSLDGTRPISCAMNGGWGTGISLVEDLQGCNYDVRGYDGFHQRFPNIPMYGSETASAVSTRGVYENDPKAGYVSAYDLNAPPWGNTAEGGWKPIADRPFMAGGFVWTGFDYKGEPTPYGWPCINSHFGIMDICGFPKDDYYYYQSWWGDKPVVHLLPHWNWAGKEGKSVPVWCQTNADRVELFLNGHSQGVKQVPRYGHVSWDVVYKPGNLEARAVWKSGYRTSDIVETTGPPAALRVACDLPTVQADGEEVSPVRVEVVDALGRVVPTAENEVSFAVAGPSRVVGVGNGDPSSHEPDRGDHRHAFNGLCMALIGAAGQPGKVHVTVSSPGLKPAAIDLTSVNAGPLK